MTAKISEKEYPFVLSCRRCGTHYAYLKEKPDFQNCVLLADIAIYATGEKPERNKRVKTCFSCGSYIVFNTAQIQFRGTPLNK